MLEVDVAFLVGRLKAAAVAVVAADSCHHKDGFVRCTCLLDTLRVVRNKTERGRGERGQGKEREGEGRGVSICACLAGVYE